MAKTVTATVKQLQQVRARTLDKAPRATSRAEDSARIAKQVEEWFAAGNRPFQCAPGLSGIKPISNNRNGLRK